MASQLSLLNVPGMRTRNEIQQVVQDRADILEAVSPQVRTSFLSWFPDNMHVVNAYEREAVNLRRNGKRKHYGTKAIGEH